MQVTMDKDELDRYIHCKSLQSRKYQFQETINKLIKTMKLPYGPKKLILNKNIDLTYELDIFDNFYTYEYSVYDGEYFDICSIDLEVSYEEFNGILKIE